ncbi:transmembrane protein 258 [Teleopsis dalmanni]|uniref:transmembrane protein 258-like n=1 Tax=Teleopsis dalmanni TaxID=139649 RepID=UPI0018CF302D|nr:transmembrane protein 258-like [Teleopsis dalmanni]XP_037939131.1 transmembrane protein 258 [Teleopsis dalmanni]
MDTMQRYVSPINPAVYPHSALVLLSIGTFFTAWFFIFVVSRPKNSKEKTLFKELLISFCASVFLGVGVVFLLLAVGIYI